VDVLLTGHAHAPRGPSVSVVSARLALRRGSTILLDKSIRVQGDWSERRKGPLPFQQIPLVY
jgi:hypothetical protein